MKLPVLALLIILFGCSSPLLDAIEEEVEIVTAPPEVSSHYPAGGAENIPITLSSVTATFTKAIEDSSVTNSTFYLTDASAAKVSGINAVDNDTLTFTPSTNLLVGSVYTVHITGIKDLDGNMIAEDYSWSFTTGIDGDTVIPVINSVTINNGDDWTTSATVTVEIDATDNFGIAQMIVSFNNTFSDSGWTVFSDSFSLDLTSGDGLKSVYIKVKDGSGNVSASSLSDSINMDTSLPLVAGLLLNSGKSTTKESTVSVAVNGEDLVDSSGVIEYQIRIAGEEWPADWSPLVDGVAFIDSFDLNISIGESQILEARVRDVAGNISSVALSSILFEQTPPEVDSVSPYENQTNVPYNTSVVEILFNEEMDPSSFSTENFYVESEGSTLAGVFKFFDNGEIPFGRVELTGLNIGPNSDYLVYIKDTIKDTAGNEFGKTKTWYFRTGTAVDTTAPEGSLSIKSFQTDPAGLDNFFELPNGDWATNRADLDLLVVADDDYNSVYAMKFWGEGDLPDFEDDASWELYTNSKIWTLDGTDRTHFLLYRLQDSAGNISEKPSQLKVIFDSTAPTISDIDISSALTGPFGYLHTNNADGLVEIVISANDLGGLGYEGSGLYQLRLSNDGVFPDINSDEEGEAGWDPDDPDNWMNWAPIISEWAIDSSTEGVKTVYLDVRDFLGTNLAAPENKRVILDKTPPTITFDVGDFNETNTETIQTATIDDNVLTYLTGLGETVSASDLTFSWRQADQNEGTISFDDSSVIAPSVSASDDGTYSLEVTVSDYAGNSIIAAIPFIWDQTPPENIALITSFDSEGNTVSTSSTAGATIYTNSAEPTIEWADSPGADLYRVIFGSPSDNDPPSWTWEDWDWQTTFPPNYLETDVAYISAPEPSFAGETDNSYRFYVTAWDKAGNRSNDGSEIHIDLGIDTLPPVITNGGQLVSTNGTATLNYSQNTPPSADENTIYDQLNPSDASAGSGIGSIDWAVVSGIGVVSINETDPRNPLFSATAEGLYELSVTVTDNASNQVTESMFFEYDITSPGTPVLNGISHTADTTPTWTWTSGGEGNGRFRYRLEMDDGSDANYTEMKPWTETDLTYYDLEVDYENDNHRFILYVEETDRAGNWSETASKKIWTDTGFTAVPPPISLTGGDYIRIIGESGSVTWTWSSGLSSGGGHYRYKLDNADLSDIVTTTDSTTSFTHAFATNGTDDGYHYLYVEEYDSINMEWVDLINSGYVRIDMTRPVTPTLSVPASPTTDTTPSWSWSGNGGGMGYFRYSVDSGNTWSYTYNNNVTLTRPNGTTTFWLQERDSAGNWSYSATDSVIIDTTPPTINTFNITSGTTTGEGNTYTTSTTVTVSISASTTDGQPMEMRFYNSGYTAWESYKTSKTFTVPSGEGVKYLYVELRDYLGNSSGLVSDRIYLDLTAPDVGTVSINNSAEYTPSLNCNLTVSSSDNLASSNELKVQYAYYNGSSWIYSQWRPLSLGTTFKTENTDNGTNEDIEFTPVAGSKLIYVRFQDPAGNTSSYSAYDTITLQIPEPTYASKGAYVYSGNGKAIVYYSTVTEDDGPTDTSYYTYWTADPNADPNNGDPVTELDSSPYSYNWVYNFGEGELRYFFIRARNDDTGGYGPYSSSSVLGFSSNVTVIYNATNPTDTARAQEMKVLLEDSDGRIANQIGSGYVVGSMPDYTVTLLPWNMVSSTIDGSKHRIDGTPIIITPQASYDLFQYATDNQVRNIVSNYNGIIAMGYYAGYIMDIIDSNFLAWGLSGTRPANITNSDSYNLISLTTAKSRPYSKIPLLAEDVWFTPLAETYFLTNGTSAMNVPIFSSDTGRRGVEITTGLDPEDGRIYAGDPNYSSRFPVVRQGRFLNFAYYEVPDTYTTGIKLLITHRSGKVFFINLVARMDDF